MENKKELISLNSNLYSSFSLEEIEERLEFGCWGNIPTPCGLNDPCDMYSTQCVAYIPCTPYTFGGGE